VVRAKRRHRSACREASVSVLTGGQVADYIAADELLDKLLG
jgi:hypothetical protein